MSGIRGGPSSPRWDRCRESGVVQVAQDGTEIRRPRVNRVVQVIQDGPR